MTFNIQEGGGTSRRQERILEVIERESPDCLIVNEGVGWFPRAQMADQIADRLDADYRIAPAASGFDLAFFSRLPIEKLVRPPLPGLLHTLAWIQLTAPDGIPLYLVGAHLDFREESHRLRETASILPAIRPLLPGYAALLGDFNALAPGDRVMGLSPYDADQVDPSHMPEWFVNRYPPEVMGLFLEAGWQDTFRHRNPSTPGYTMSTSDPNARYDYVLLSPSLATRARDAFVVAAPPASSASDHFAVVVDLDWQP